jgi:exodeoxyribonuclease-3
MKIISWNVNGIRAVEKKGFVQWVLETSPDILCLQETKAHIDQLSDALLNIDGYHAYFHSGERRGYSGTAVYSKTPPLRTWTGLPDERFNREGRTIVMEFEEFLLMNIYFPNGQKDEDRLQFKLDFYDSLLDYANSLVSGGKRLVICGDYNTAHKEIDLKNPKANEKYSGFLPVERDWMDKFVSNGYVDTYRTLHPDTEKYSWWSYRFSAREKNVGWRIDYFFVSENLRASVLDADIHNEVLGSDHCPISLELAL